MPNPQSSFESGRVEANGISLSYYRSGGSKPALVLAHGMTDMGLCWTRVAEGLLHKYDVILYDARGHGDSEAPEAGYDPDTRCEDLRGLLLALNLDKPRLLGHSLGAMTVALLAAKYPDMVRSIVLEDPPLPDQLSEPAKPEQLKSWDDQWLQWKNSIVEQLRLTRSALESQCRRQSPHWHDLEIGPWADAKTKVSPNIFNTHNLMTTNWWRSLPQVSCPTMLLTADVKRGALMSATAEAELRKSCPDVTFVRLPGAGHNIHREQYERYMSIVADFLARN